MSNFTLSDFDYHLPEELIAQSPMPMRTQSRLLTVPFSRNDHFVHGHFPDIERYLKPGDLLVFNDTKVIPARLSGVKASGGKISCLIERILDDHRALVHIRASHAPLVGSILLFENVIKARVIARHDALFELEFLQDESVLTLLEQYGDIPLPPYITRQTDEHDVQRYQTVYARHPGAVAAPTAGLHFDEKLLSALKDKGVQCEFVTLHVGAGTFQPVRVDDLDQHKMHAEQVVVSDALCEAVKATRARGNRVFAIGTTVVRALETASRSGEIKPYFGDSQLFIRPGFEFHCVDALLTNFHLPKSTLLMLVSALAGYERVMTAYTEAVAKQYRFFSYGDAMLLVP